MRSHRAIRLGAFAVGIWLAVPVAAQVTVVNMIKKENSGESHRDSEPSIAVDPANPQHIAATAFTPYPSGSNAPIYFSTDGGNTWDLNPILQGNHPDTGTGDVTLRFGTSSHVLYVAELKKTVSGTSTIRKLNIARTPDFTSPSVTQVLVEREAADQPYVQAISAPDASGALTDRVFVSYGYVPSGGGATAEWSLDAAAMPPPGGFPPPPQQGLRLDARGSCSNFGPTVTALHASGTVYAAFFHWTSCTDTLNVGDVTVMRDDAWGAGNFQALKDPPAPQGDGQAGMRVARQVEVTGGALGAQRLGALVSLAVDPGNKDKLCLAWGQGATANDFTVHVRCSKDGGASWSGDHVVATPATNASLAINSLHQVGLLYQKLAPGSVPRWETWLEVSGDDFATAPRKILLHRAPDNFADDPKVPAGPLGDYDQLMAVGRNFYGVFSGDNTPDLNNFPQGVTYQRYADFTAHKLLASDQTTVVQPSSDPFFFVDRELAIPVCVQHPGLCDRQPRMKRGAIRLKCLQPNCVVVDPLPRNCLVKFTCPGCKSGGICPPYYNVTFDGLRSAWKVELFDADGNPVPHHQFKRGSKLVVSFRPAPDSFVSGTIGDYSFAFTMGAKGKVGTEYWVKTRLTRSEHEYRPPKKKSGP